MYKSHDTRRSELRKKVISFAIFFVLASIFWFLNTLEANYTETIKFPLVFEVKNREHIQTQNLPSHVNVRITTTGYELLRYYFGMNQHPIHFHLSAKPKELNKTQFILIRSIVEKELAQRVNKIVVENVWPDTVKYRIEPMAQKKVPVRANVKFKMEKDYVLKSTLKLSPDSVVIRGGVNAIKTIDYVSTGFVDLGILKNTHKANLAIQSDPHLSYDKYRINVTVPIEQTTENVLDVPITISKNSTKHAIKLIPNHITVRFRVGLSQYKLITANQFVAEVEYNDSTKSQPILQVHIKRLPKSIYVYSFSPNFVEYIIEKND